MAKKNSAIKGDMLFITVEKTVFNRLVQWLTETERAIKDEDGYEWHKKVLKRVHDAVIKYSYKVRGESIGKKDGSEHVKLMLFKSEAEDFILLLLSTLELETEEAKVPNHFESIIKWWETEKPGKASEREMADLTGSGDVR